MAPEPTNGGGPLEDGARWRDLVAEVGRGIVAISADAVLAVDDAQRIVLFNESAERLFGWTADEIVGEPLDRLLPAADHAAHRHAVRAFGEGPEQARAMAGRRMVRALRRDGREIPVQCAISRIQFAGEQLYAAVLRDMSDVVRRLDEKRFLAEAGAVLSASLQVEATLVELGQLAVRHLADLCIVDLVREREVRRLRVLVRDAARTPLAHALETVPLDRDRPHLVSRVLETREAELIEQVDASFLEGVAQGPDHLQLLQAIGPRSLLGLPLVARGRVVGALVLLSTDTRHDERDLQVGQELASRAALALDNAQLHEALARANEELHAKLREIQEARATIETLTGLLPLCAWCGRIREAPGGAWLDLETFLANHTDARLSHGICVDCRDKHFPEG